MSKYRLFFLVLLLISGCGLAVMLFVNEVKTPLEVSFAPVFQIAGETTKTVSTAVGKVLPVDSLDEKELGDRFRNRYETYNNAEDADYVYVNKLLQDIAVYAKRPFEYRAFVSDSSIPNACALPGGTIIVTKGLLNILGSEAELISVLAHEVGHIEQSHCFNAVKYELLAKKIGSDTLGRILDFTEALLVSHSYSKTQENEADEYSYRLVRNTIYDPRSSGLAFHSLLEYSKYNDRRYEYRRNDVSIVRDYFSSHPPLELRYEKFREKANQWWKYNMGERRYLGVENLRQRETYRENSYDAEWYPTQNSKQINLKSHIG